MPRKRKSLDVDELDIMAEIDAMRPTKSSYKRSFTPEQDAALWAARRPEGKTPVRWADLLDWWEKRWGNINVDTMRRRLRELEQEREE